MNLKKVHKESLIKGEANVSDARKSDTEMCRYYTCSAVKRFDQRFIKFAAVTLVGIIINLAGRYAAQTLELPV